MSLSIALMNALSGLQLNQRALDVTAQNVANVNTEGYSRKVVQQQAVVIDGRGAGVEIAQIARKVNEFMMRDLRSALSQVAESRVSDTYFKRLQDSFGSPQSNSSIGANIAELAARLQALAARPEDLSIQTEVVDRARLLSQQINAMAGQTQEMRLQADRDIAGAVTDINSQLTQIQELNINIAGNLAQNRPVSELQDQRDRAIDRIAEQMNINYFFRSNGEVVIFTETGRTLLDRTPRLLAHDAITTASPTTIWDEGTITGITLAGADITSEINSGRIGALIDMRDTTLPNVFAQLSELSQALQNETNAIHNRGTGFPGQASLTGSRRVAASDVPPWTGVVRIATTDTAGVVTEFSDLDLSTYATVGDLVTAIDGMTNIAASINSSGSMVLTATGTNRIAINEMTSAVTMGDQTMGASSFFGLNDLFTSATQYQDYASGQQVSETTALGLTGTLTIRAGAASAGINYVAGNSLIDIAASINADATLSAANVSAQVITDGGGFRLRITETTGPTTLFITDSANLVSTLGIEPRSSTVAQDLSVRADILSDPSRLARGQLSNAGGLLVGDVGIASGDARAIQSLADRFDQDLAFNAVGGLAARTHTMAEFGVAILALDATQAASASDTLASREFLFDNLTLKTRSISGVNLDEEMANMVVLENAYAASARVISVTSRLFELLSNIGR
jgi:flagellar hook-associated protein 1